jgi:hypothetical protein
MVGAGASGEALVACVHAAFFDEVPVGALGGGGEAGGGAVRLAPAEADRLARALTVGVAAWIARGVRAHGPWPADAPALRVSAAPVRWLPWVVAALGRAGRSSARPEPPVPPPVDPPATPADAVVAAALVGLLVRQGRGRAADALPFRGCALVAALHPAWVPHAPPLDGWTSGEGAFVWRALRPALAEAVIAFEDHLLAQRAPEAVRALGEARGRQLDGWLAAGAADPLLVDFLVDAAPGLPFARPLSLDAGASLRARQDAGRAAGAQLRAIGALTARWERARATPFVAEGYDAAAALARRWAALGGTAAAVARAERMRREIGLEESACLESSSPSSR